MEHIPRVVEQKEENTLLKMVMMILALPRVETQAITVFPGMGEIWRLQHAVKTWDENHRIRDFLVAGCEWKKEKTSPQPTLELLQAPPYSLDGTIGVHIHEHARHTPDQVEWVVEMVRSLKIESLSLVVSPYHLPRAYLTLLKEFLKLGPIIPIIPLPVPMAPNTIIPESQVDSWTMVDGEMERIQKYQQKGDVATFQELKTYLDWLWHQPLLLRS